MMIYLLIGIIVGAGLGGSVIYLALRPRWMNLETQQRTDQSQLAALNDEKLLIQQQLAVVQDDRNALNGQNTALSKELELVREQLKNDLKTQQLTHTAQLETMKAEFKNLAAEVMKQKSSELQDSNRTQLSPLLSALKEQMGAVNEKMEKVNRDSSVQKAQLETTIRSLMERTLEIGTEANKLAEALKGGNMKKQGVFGELILKDLLVQSGLKEGEQFECEYTIRDENGQTVRNEDSNRRMRPDVILHYPDYDLVIDAKTSLTAYVDWCNAATDEARKEAADRHIRSIEQHVRELTDKSYQTYLRAGGRKIVDYCIMFIPTQGALELLMETRSQLWHEAYEKHVIITSQLSLFSMLRMIQYCWIQIEQQRNQEKILATATTLIKRVGEFNDYFLKIGRSLESAQETYSEARKKFTDGRQSIAVSARQLTTLGISEAKQRLPEVSDGMPELE